MRLTKFQREAFVQAVMNDVPKIDYQELARVSLQRWAIDHLPTKLKAVHKEFGHYFKTDSLWNLPRNLRSVYVVTHKESETLDAMKADSDFWARIVEYAKSLDEQKSKLDALEAKVKGLAFSCSTTNQLREQAPEFAKYLPEESEGVDRSLPVVQNIVADLVKAGWPKDQPKKTSARKAA